MGNLDELLESIKAEAKRESALTLYKGTRQDDLVDEEVDERILRLLGLEDTFDIDYATYISLLREKMAAARMTGSQMATEEAELLTNEFKRVKRKVGRFKLKKKKISVDSSESSFLPALRSKKIQVDSVDSVIPDSKSLKPQEESGGGDKSAIDAVSKELSRSSNILQRIGQVLSQQLSLQKGAIREDKKESKDLNKEEREKELEKKKSLVRDRKKSFKEFKAPAMGFFDSLKNYFKNILLGSILLTIVNWFKDPENQKKIQDFTNFVQNNIPLILGGLAAIALLPLAASLLSFTGMLLTVAIPALFKVLTLFATPLGIKALLVALGIGAAVSLIDAIKTGSAGGSGLRAAIEAENKIIDDMGINREGGFLDENAMKEAGITPIPGTLNVRQVLIKTGEYKGFYRLEKPGGEAGALPMPVSVFTRNANNTGFVATTAQVEGFNTYKKRIKRFTEEKNAMNKEIDEARSRIITDDKDDLQLQEFEQERARIREKYNAPYREQYGNPSMIENMTGKFQQLNDQSDTAVENVRESLRGIINPEQNKPAVPGAPDPSLNTSFINLGGDQSSEVATSAATPKQSSIPFFSANDPKNISLMSTRSIYSLVD